MKEDTISWLRRCATFLLITIIAFACSTASKERKEVIEKDDVWEKAQTITNNIKRTNFKDVTYNIEDFGAVEGGVEDCGENINNAITTCHSNGGGLVVVPKGTFLTGPIYLKSNVNLHLEEGAILKFSINPGDYLPPVHTRWEGVEMMGYSPLIYAFEEENIALTGKGILDGQAENSNWWSWKGREEYGWESGMPSQKDSASRPRLFRMGQNDVPVEDRIFVKDTYLRPQFFQPYRCKRVLVEGVTFMRSPMWIIHPVLSEHIIIDGVTVDSHGPNNDGCDPESSKNIWIKNCKFNTGDDCIAIKSGRNRDGRRVGVASENIVIQNCIMKNGHGGVVIGSEASGGVNNVYAENCRMDSPYLERALRIKTSSQRGGVVEHIYLRDINVGQVREAAIKFNMFYGDPGDHMPTIRNIGIRNMKVENGGKYGIWAEGYESSPIQDVELINCTIKRSEEKFHFKNVEGFEFNEVTINGEKVAKSF